MLCNVGTMTVLQTIRILVVIQLFENTRCQDGFGDREILRYHQMAINDDQSQMDAFNSYGALFQRSQNTQTINSDNNQYVNADDQNKNEYRSPQARSRKIYHIKNPFQDQEDKNDKSQDNSDPQDSVPGASNQYASVQYSLPPEEFLQQLRAENQYHQQQLSTPAPNIGFTVTPQPQYQYSTISVSSSGYDTNNQQNSQIQLESQPAQSYLSSPSPYQYSTPNTFLDNFHSTPSPVTPYLSTPINNNQFASQSSSYVSSASPVYLSSPSNLQQYVSSPLTSIHTGSPDYGNSRITSTIGNSLRYDSDQNKHNQLQQYDYSRFSNSLQQYQHDYTTTTTTASPYFDYKQTWQNILNPGSPPKSVQDVNFAQYQNAVYNNNHQERQQTNSESNNDDTHRMGSMASANNIYMNYAQPDNKANTKIHTRDLEQETGQKVVYSNGDYGWKLTDKKPASANNDAYSLGFSRNQMPTFSSDSTAVSQMNFHLDSSRSPNYDKVSKSASEDFEAQEFAKAAAKAHDRLKQQQQFFNNNYGQSSIGNDPDSNYYYSSNHVQKSINNHPYINTHNDLITASPYYISNIKDDGDTKPKQPFDHEKALKTIVPISASNVVSNVESQPKTSISLDNINRFNLQNYGKDQQDQKQYIRPVADSYYKDKNSVYNFNLNSKPEEYVTPESPKQSEASVYVKYQNHKNQEKPYSIANYGFSSQNLGYSPQQSNYQDNYMQGSASQQPGLYENQNQFSRDITGILRFSDVPYKLTQGLSSDALKLHNINFDQSAHVIPTPLPNRINQNVDSHQLEVATNLLNRLLLSKQMSENINRPEINSQADSLSTINGFKVANPFNVDLKLVADILKGKSTLDDSQMMSVRDQYNKHTPMKLDISQLQSLINNENNGNLHFMNDHISNPFLDIYSNSRYPYKGVKYSRSEEEEESIIPIVESSNNHPIGAVVEQSDPASDREVPDTTGQEDNLISTNLDDSRGKPNYVSSNHKLAGDRHRNPNLLSSGRHSHQRKYPKSEVEEPYPLLKPPPPHTAGSRHSYARMEKNNRRRRVSKLKYHRLLKTEPLYEAGTEPEISDTSMSILLRPPPLVAEAKSDVLKDEREQTT